MTFSLFNLKRSICIALALGAAVSAHAALRTWSGAGTTIKWSTAANWVENIAPVPGDDLYFPPIGSVANNNDYPAGTTFNSLTLSGQAYNLNGNSIALNAGLVATNFSQSTISLLLILNSNQTFTIDVQGNFFFAVSTSAINLSSNTLTFDVNSPAVVQDQGVISGTGGLIKNGTGGVSLYESNSFSGPVQVNAGNLSAYHGNALGATNGNTTIATNGMLVLANPITVPEPIVLSGTIYSVGGGVVLTGPISLSNSNATILVSTGTTNNSLISGAGGLTKGAFGTLVLNSNNTYTGITTIASGALRVNGSQPSSPVLLTGGGLEGTGTVGTVTTSANSYLTPGVGGLGILTCSNLTLDPTATFQVSLNGATPGSGYSQLNVKGSVTLSNAHLTPLLGFAPAAGTAFVILTNDGSDSVSGTFKNLPEGAAISTTNLPLRISYIGGSGNDITLTPFIPPARFSLISRPTNNVTQLQATGAVSTLVYTLLAATNLQSSMQWSNIPSAAADSNGKVVFTVTNPASLSRRFYRVLSP